MAQRSPDVESLIVRNMKPLTCIDCGAEGHGGGAPSDVEVLGGRFHGWTVTRRLHCGVCGLTWQQVNDRRRVWHG